MKRDVSLLDVFFYSLALCFCASPFISLECANCFGNINPVMRTCLYNNLLYKNITISKCCQQVDNYYTVENDSIGDLFRKYLANTISLRGGKKGNRYGNRPNTTDNKCYSCKDWQGRSLKYNITCQGIKCPYGRVCNRRMNSVTCTCPRTKCSSIQHPKQVCSNLNITYPSECHLKKNACRVGRYESVAYDGSCQASCNKVRCRPNKQCFQDQTNQIHCALCSNLSCTAPKSNLDMVCGLNNVTYDSACHLRKETCKLGKSIGIAYAGKCQNVRNCKTIKCAKRNICIMDGKIPLCIDCRIKQCKRPPKRPTQHLLNNVCGSDGMTYQDFCFLRDKICKRKVPIHVINDGKCRGIAPNQIPPFSFTKLRILRRRKMSVLQLIRAAQKVGITFTTRRNAVSNILSKRVSVNRFLHYLYIYINS